MAICYAALMVPEPSIFEIDEEAEAAADAEGMADVAAGRVVPHEDVAAWLDTWGTPAELISASQFVFNCSR